MFASLVRAITVPHDSQVRGSITAPHDSEQMSVQKEADNVHLNMHHRATCIEPIHARHAHRCMHGWTHKDTHLLYTPDENP